MYNIAETLEKFRECFKQLEGASKNNEFTTAHNFLKVSEEGLELDIEKIKEYILSNFEKGFIYDW